MNHPQPQIIAIWRILLTLAAMIPAFLVSLLFKSGSTVWIISIGTLALVYLLIFLVYFPLLYKKMSYSVSGERIIYKTGVLLNRIISVPVSAVQFVSVSQSALEKPFGLAAVSVTMAGGRIILSGLTLEDAQVLAKIIQPQQAEPKS